MLSGGTASDKDRNPAIKICSAFKLALVRAASDASRSDVQVKRELKQVFNGHEKTRLCVQGPAEPASLQPVPLLTCNTDRTTFNDKLSRYSQ